MNLLLIAAIVLLPFCTDSVGDLETDLPLPVVVMAVDIAAAWVLITLVFLLAARRGLFLEQPDRAEVIAYCVGGLLPAVVFAASIPIAYLVSRRPPDRSGPSVESALIRLSWPARWTQGTRYSAFDLQERPSHVWARVGSFDVFPSTAGSAFTVCGSAGACSGPTDVAQ